MEQPKIKVDSSAIESVSFDNETGVLRVWLISGRVYDYFNVPQVYFDSFLSAPSKGIYYNTVIKKKFDKYREIIEI